RQPDVERAKDAARQRNGEDRLEWHQRVGRQHGHPLARGDPKGLQRGREALDALAELRVREAPVTVDDGHVLRVNRRAPLEEILRIEFASVYASIRVERAEC